MYHYLDEKCILFEKQFFFKARRSTGYTILELSDEISKFFNNPE